mmetsp:Transcript_4343/g.18486  ORF Transcript_4343/g.18486 Transcript_4343/m.18486 type:complete len:385 (+) Transcript_4343:160-1314(+)
MIPRFTPSFFKRASSGESCGVSSRSASATAASGRLPFGYAVTFASRDSPGARVMEAGKTAKASCSPPGSPDSGSSGARASSLTTHGNAEGFSMVTRATLGGSTGFFFFFRFPGGRFGKLTASSAPSPVSAVSPVSSAVSSFSSSFSSSPTGSGRLLTSGPNSNVLELLTNTPRTKCSSGRDFTTRAAPYATRTSSATRGYSHRPVTRSVSTRAPPTHSNASSLSKSPAASEAKRTRTIVAPPAGITQRVCSSISGGAGVSAAVPEGSPSSPSLTPSAPSAPSASSFPASSFSSAAAASSSFDASRAPPPPGRSGCTAGVRIWNAVTGSRSARAARAVTISQSSSGGIQSGGLGGSGAPAATAASSKASASSGNAPASTVARSAC